MNKFDFLEKTKVMLVKLQKDMLNDDNLKIAKNLLPFWKEPRMKYQAYWSKINSWIDTPYEGNNIQKLEKEIKSIALGNCYRGETAYYVIYQDLKRVKTGQVSNKI